MCGIFGIITTLQNQNIWNIIIDGLVQLQNRGYDSSGICLLDKEQQLIIHKYASTNLNSSIEKLQNLNVISNSHIGIGHNRWATHGGKTDNNSHPHTSNDGNFVIVHNGIIENYQELKNMLTNNGFIFYTQTDTEIIVNLISYFYNQNNNTFNSIGNAIELLEGTYGLIILNKLEPNNIYAVRNGSPLLVGYNDKYAILTSEQSGFCNLVNNYITLNNDDICVIKIIDNNINVQTNHNYISKNINVINNEITPFPFKHWTIKEIYEQPKTILNVINNGGRIKNDCQVKLGGLEQHKDKLLNINNIIILGCGTSYHAGLYGMNYFKKMCNFNCVSVFDGAEFNYYDIPKIGNTAFILISQSGETKDLHRCLSIAKEHNIFTIGVINVVDSLIAREVNCGIYCNAGREIGVASTKAFTSQVICLSLLSIWFAQEHNINENKRFQMISDLHNLTNDYKNTIDSIDLQIQDIAKDLLKYNNLFILGKGTDGCIAKEGSLKIKEISYIHSEAYSSGSLKHGPFALLDENFPVILISCVHEHETKTLNCFEEVYSRNSEIIFITNNKNLILNKKCSLINIDYNETYNSLIGIIPFQLLAYYISIFKNINPDIPKNLAKVVTVE